jgi:hypothetical protein
VNASDQQRLEDDVGPLVRVGLGPIERGCEGATWST